MKLLRCGNKGSEKPAALDKKGKIRDLSSSIRDLDPENLNFETLSKLPVGIRDGFTIAIGEVADLNFVETYSSIARENSKRRVAVLINPEDSDIAGYVEQAKIYLAGKLKLSTGNIVFLNPIGR